MLITGGSSGIGAGLAEAFVGEGATVGIAARRADRLAEVLDRCTPDAPGSRLWAVDLADPDQVDRLARDAVAELGGVDILVNNAGVPKRRHVAQLDPDTVERSWPSTTARRSASPWPSSPTCSSAARAGSSTSPGGRAPQLPRRVRLRRLQGRPGRLLRGHGRRPVGDRRQGDRGLSRRGRHELFTLPDNDPFTGDVPAITVDEAVRTILDGVAAGSLSVFVPEYFSEFASQKAQNPENFLAGMAQYIRPATGAKVGPGA